MKSDPMSNLRNRVTLKKKSTIEYKTCGFDFEERNELKLFHYRFCPLSEN